MKLSNRPELLPPTPGDLLIQLSMEEVAPSRRKQKTKAIAMINRVVETGEGSGDYMVYYSYLFPKNGGEYLDYFSHALQLFHKYQKVI